MDADAFCAECFGDGAERVSSKQQQRESPVVLTFVPGADGSVRCFYSLRPGVSHSAVPSLIFTSFSVQRPQTACDRNSIVEQEPVEVEAEVEVEPPDASASARPNAATASKQARQQGTDNVSRGKCAVRKSGLDGAGNGLFAVERIVENELFTKYGGRWIDYAEARRLKAAGLHTHIRAVNAHGFCLDARDLTGDMCAESNAFGSFANDGRSTRLNNAAYCTRWDHNSAQLIVYLRALREIAPGEEIFVSYGRDYWRRAPAL